jgi:hypothetical protein
MFLRQFARSGQNTRQVTIPTARGSLDQLAFPKEERRHAGWYLNRKRPRLAGEVDQVQELGRAKVPQISF